MKDEAESGVTKKIGEVEGEQGMLKEVSGEPPENFGHGSVASAGVTGSIPKES